MKKLFKLAFAAGMMLWLPASVMAQTEVKLEVLDNTPGNLLDNLLAKGLAFDNDGNATVTSLVIGGSLDATDWETIGQCALLTKLDLGKVNCERIPKNTLAKNVNIESLVLPSNIKILDPLFDQTVPASDKVNPPYTSKDYFYPQCEPKNKIKNIELPNGITSVMGAAFLGWASLEKVEIPESVTFDFGYWGTFYGCASLTEIKFPDAWRLKQTEFRQGFICNCDKLTDIAEFPNVVTIANHNFEGCAIHPEIVFERFPKMEKVSGPLFANLTCEVKKLEVPERIIEIGLNSFAMLKGLEELKLHNNGKIFTGSYGSGQCHFAPFFRSEENLKKLIITGPAYDLVNYTDTKNNWTGLVSFITGRQNYIVEGLSTRLPEDCYLYVDDDKVDDWKATSWNEYMNGRIRGIGEMPSGIENVVVEHPADNTIYDLMGRKVTNPSTGIYIQNGKKIFIR